MKTQYVYFYTAEGAYGWKSSGRMTMDRHIVTETGWNELMGCIAKAHEGHGNYWLTSLSLLHTIIVDSDGYIVEVK